MSTSEHILVERDDAILWITINRPQALNALNPLAHRELSSALDSFADRSRAARRRDHWRRRTRILRRQRLEGARHHQCG